MALLILALPLRAEPFELPPLSMRVNDFAAVLNPSYSADLNRRLARFDEKTGYAIYIALTANDDGRSLTGVARELFERNQLDKSWSAGAVLVLITPGTGAAAVATSENLRKQFSGPQVGPALFSLGIDSRKHRIHSSSRR